MSSNYQQYQWQLRRDFAILNAYAPGEEDWHPTWHITPDLLTKLPRGVDVRNNLPMTGSMPAPGWIINLVSNLSSYGDTLATDAETSKFIQDQLNQLIDEWNDKRLGAGVQSMELGSSVMKR